MKDSKAAPVVARATPINFSVEEENLASIPFAVLERRVGKKIGKLELKGTKSLPDGSKLHVVWQVQGNNDLGLPTEQDLDIFVALGVLTFQNNFGKTVVFTGRDIARILNISGVHGKFYQRIKLAMDRFIPLRFRAIATSERQEEVKWCNVFQEASFSLDRSTGRCVGSVTWTDKLIQSMDSGFFRVLDASRYMQLDGITAKHLYRYLAVAFEKTNLVVIDARKLATEHLGIVNVPKYFSRLLQTLEPAFDQLVRIQVLTSYHVVSTEDWTVALHRHAGYLPESKTLLDEVAAGSPELKRAHCGRSLELAGMPGEDADSYARAATTPVRFFALERAARLLDAMRELEVLPHVALAYTRRALDEDSAELLDRCQIAVELCRKKRESGQKLKNAAGLLVKLLKCDDTWKRFVGAEHEAAAKERFRQREQAALRQEEDAEQRTLIFEYERFRREMAAGLLEELSDDRKRALRKEKADVLRQHERFDRLPPEARQQEIDEMILQDLAKAEVPPFEKWYLRRRARQAVLPFDPGFATEAGA